ncbi:Abi family protein [Fusobacterium varium]|uniref:Abi family protein n=1 Tax=Fusobacterium varium TaxID=856 RepID=UPI002431894A|nr:Abi family protein [Fusobacterium varium]
MAYDKKHLDFEEQLDLLISRGMKVNKREEAIEKLKNINYYKIKEFAEPYFKEYFEEGIKKYRYEKIAFEEVITRFYQDKNLRIYFLHAIEKVELSFKAKFAYLLGKKYGAFGYLKFNNWCNKKEYCKHYLREKQEQFEAYIKRNMKKDTNFIIKEYFEENPENEFPPIWMLIEILTFGEILNLYGLMSEVNREEIANFYDCTDEELVSWLKNLKLVRNLAAHNSCILDIKFITQPVLRKEWHQFIYTFKNNKNQTIISNRIVVSVVILKYLISKINYNYSFGNFYKALSKLIRGSDGAARKYGFSNKNIQDWIFTKWK